MPRILHLSDLHFGDELLSWSHLRQQGQWASKQLVGWLNHRLNPSRHFRSEVKTQLVARLLKEPWDLCVITGDLVHLGTEAEFQLARQTLEPLIRKGPVLLTAGNHDRYTPATLGRLEAYFGDCYPFDRATAQLFCGPEGWGLLELPMAEPTQWGAKGRFLGDQERYQRLINEHPGPVVLYGHYPLFHPPEHPEPYSHRLRQIPQVRQLAHSPKVQAYLHGHVHHSWAFQPEGADLWSVCAGSSLKEGYWMLELEAPLGQPVRQSPPL